MSNQIRKMDTLYRDLDLEAIVKKAKWHLDNPRRGLRSSDIETLRDMVDYLERYVEDPS